MSGKGDMGIAGPANDENRGGDGRREGHRPQDNPALQAHELQAGKDASPPITEVAQGSLHPVQLNDGGTATLTHLAGGGRFDQTFHVHMQDYQKSTAAVIALVESATSPAQLAGAMAQLDTHGRVISAIQARMQQLEVASANAQKADA